MPTMPTLLKNEAKKNKEWVAPQIYVYRKWMDEQFCTLCGLQFEDGQTVQDCNIYGEHHPDCEPY